jgi:hypothetical protein
MVVTTSHLCHLLACALCALHAGLLCWHGSVHSLTENEAGHLASAASLLELGRLDLYCVNPPLTKYAAAVSLGVVPHKTDWTRYRKDILTRPEFDVAADFTRANARSIRTLVSSSRYTWISFSVVGMVTCYCWGRRLCGDSAAVFSICLWCFSPLMLGHGSLVTTDMPAASFGCLSGFRLWCWTKSHTWKDASLFGITLGLALLCKFTILALVPVFVMLALFAVATARCLPIAFGQMAMSAGLALLLVNAAYHFEGTGASLGSHNFCSRLLRGAVPQGTLGNRFADGPCAGLSVPLPRLYCAGMDLQKRDIENEQHQYRSYLCGAWYDTSHWYYYLFCALIKARIPVLIILCISCVCIIYGLWTRCCKWSDILFIAGPPVFLITAVSASSGFDMHFRYILPAVPYLFVSCAYAWSILTTRAVRIVLVILSAWAMLAGAAAMPHSISYFNEFVGGSNEGYKYLHSSSVDWGQDLYFLQSWRSRNTDKAPLHVLFRGPLTPTMAEIDCVDLKPLPQGGGSQLLNGNGALPRGWYVVATAELISPGGVGYRFSSLPIRSHLTPTLLLYEVDGL